jgi:hypothetical protein
MQSSSHLLATSLLARIQIANQKQKNFGIFPTMQEHQQLNTSRMHPFWYVDSMDDNPHKTIDYHLSL